MWPEVDKLLFLAPTEDPSVRKTADARANLDRPSTCPQRKQKEFLNHILKKEETMYT
jgi:hypothetical protein